MHPIGYERNTARQRHTNTHPLKGARRRDFGIRDMSISPSTSARESFLHKHEFVPTGNRFSILAELDQQSNQTEWAFDFHHIPNAAVRRRGERAAKNSKSKFVRLEPYEAAQSESESIEDLFNRVAALCLDNADSNGESTLPSYSTRNQAQHDNYTGSVDAVRHPWMPQFQPNSKNLQSLSSTTPAKPANSDRFSIPQSPARCWTQAKDPPPPFELPNFKRKESRFFPLSTFLSSTETASHPISPKPSISKSPESQRAKKELAIVVPTKAQKAAASAACRALVTPKAPSAPLITSMRPQSSRPASPLPLGLTSSPALPYLTTSLESSQTATAPSSATSHFSSLAITPSLSASQTLPTSPVISELPSLTSPLSVVSAPSTFSDTSSLAADPLRTPTSPSTSGTWTPVPWLSLPQTPTMPSSTTTSTGPDPPPPLPKRTPGIISVAPFFPKPSVPTIAKPPAPPAPTRKPVPPPLPPRPKSQIQTPLSNFLKMSHPNPCWCSSHGPTSSVPKVEVEEQDQGHKTKTPIRVLTSPKLRAVVEKAGFQGDGVDLSDDIEIGRRDDGVDEGFESVQREEEDEEGWTVVLPEARYGKLSSKTIQTDKVEEHAR
ncbi:hypothetical protein K469DRAFT_719913 [Zopfia rhizophila CBS 207.26]|uniref:Uncharacterized protein n=1 Tax=Zopfia rhizophila CBS 207.26 TaxID=1314779 RepID=A0A6A6EJS9_9PEZI|nr:hypothetical protein K469DRAFT_719913 [Zopfia rhizophila CBS 207.26]